MLRVNLIRRVLLTCGTSIALKTKLGWRFSLGTSLTFSFYVSNLLNATVQSYIFFPKPASYVLPLKPFARLVLAGKQGWRSGESFHLPAMCVNDLCSKRFFSRQPCFFCSSKIVQVSYSISCRGDLQGHTLDANNTKCFICKNKKELDTVSADSVSVPGEGEGRRGYSGTPDFKWWGWSNGGKKSKPKKIHRASNKSPKNPWTKS